MMTIKASHFASLLGLSAMLTATAALSQSTAPRPGPLSAAGASQPELTVTVSQFQFTGNSALSGEQLASVLRHFVDRPLTLEQLNRAAEEVQALYRSKGWFLARAYLPVQAPKDGVVEIAILEGRIDKVTVNVAADAPISAAKAQAVANAYLHSGQPITDAGIERPMLLLRDVPRVGAKSVVEPGSTVGTANIAIEVSNDLSTPVITGRVELDNHGTPATGRTRLTGEMNVNNPYAVGDQLSLRAFVANEHGNAFGRASYTLPVGYYGTRVGASLARLNYVLGDEFAALEPKGVANVASLNASHPLVRGKYANLLAQLVLERKKLTDEIALLGIRETSSLRAATFSLNGDWRDSAVSANQVSLSLGHGKLTFDDPLRQALDQSPVFGLHASGSYTKLMLTARRVHQLTASLQGLISLSGQRANKNLPGAEKFALGGPGTIRAYPIGEVIGDHGFAMTMELQYAIPGLSHGGCTTAATGFYDSGRVTLNHDNPPAYTGFVRRAIGGVGIGLNVDCASGLMVRLALATPTLGELPGGSSTRAWIMAGYGF
jgi:hemolysin activation/secretion protein